MTQKFLWRFFHCKAFRGWEFCASISPILFIQSFEGLIEDRLPIRIIAAGGLQSNFNFKSLLKDLKEGHLCYLLQLCIVIYIKVYVEHAKGVRVWGGGKAVQKVLKTYINFHKPCVLERHRNRGIHLPNISIEHSDRVTISTMTRIDYNVFTHSSLRVLYPGHPFLLPHIGNLKHTLRIMIELDVLHPNDRYNIVHRSEISFI